MEDKLKEYGLKIKWNEDQDREPIDFNIEDDRNSVAWVWGSEPFNDVQVECNHPTEHGCVEFGDDDEQGECVLCGAKCDWHYEDDSGSVEDYHWKGKDRCIDEWYFPKEISGIIGTYLKELQRKW